MVVLKNIHLEVAHTRVEREEKNPFGLFFQKNRVTLEPQVCLLQVSLKRAALRNYFEKERFVCVCR